MNALLTNKTAVIYGAGDGLGAGIASTFARQGARVHLCGRTRGPLDRVAAAVQAAGGTAEVAVLDARDPQAVQAHLEQVGRLDISFNLISRGDVQGKPLTAMTAAEFMAPIEVGPHANFVTATAASYLRQPGDRLFRAVKFDVLRIEGDKIVEATTFAPELFGAFGLPETLQL